MEEIIPQKEMGLDLQVFVNQVKEITLVFSGYIHLLLLLRNERMLSCSHFFHMTAVSSYFQ